MRTEDIIKSIRGKSRVLFYCFWIVVLIVILRVGYILLFSENKVSSENYTTESVIEASRGSILARDGRPLVISIPRFEIRFDYSPVNDSIFNSNVSALSRELSRLFRDKSEQAYRKEILAAKKAENKYKKLGNRDISYSELERLKQFPIFREKGFRGGLVTVQKEKRTRPFHPLADRTLGYINSVGEGAGIELSYNHILRGIDGKRTMTYQPGNWLQLDPKEEVQPQDGYDIQTTLDIDIQEAADKALREQLARRPILEGGTAIVMETETGAIRAMVNLKKDKNGEFTESYNYAIAEASDPGSTLKLAALISLLEDGHVNLDDEIDGEDGTWTYYRKVFSDTREGGYGIMSVKDAFALSSNVAFAKMMTEHYEDNPDEYVSRLYDFKLGERLNLDISGEGYTTIWTPDDKPWSMVSLPQMGLGYEVLITPMHTLTYYNAVANQGKMVKPYFIENTQKNGIIDQEFHSKTISGSICSKKTIREVTEALEEVVNNGTAENIKDDRYRIAGKTGTAQILNEEKRYVDAKGYKKFQASFAGFFPADDPKYSCIVVIYSGKTRGNVYGSTWAAPVFKKISDHIYITHPEWKTPISGKGMVAFDNPNIASGRSDVTKTALNYLETKNVFNLDEGLWINSSKKDDQTSIVSLENEAGVVPNLMNMGLRDALYMIENKGYKANVKGSGRVVSQEPKAGTMLRENSEITIVLKQTK